MAEFSEVIRDRRSVRNYEDRPIPEAVLSHILDAAKWTPSWANSQCWEVIVVKDLELKRQLQGAMEKTNPAWKSMAAAPVVLAICGKLNSSGFYKEKVTTKFGDWFLFDLGLFTQSLCLAAQDQGIGSVITGLFDHNQAKAILKVPDGFELVSLIPVGYPARIPSAPKRREPVEFTHYETF
ncbi:MAG: nitroreductase family protein [Desulfobacterales bacterium]|jgi:nitroreductase|nr:nitroreductase family protein [Desulfobacterales bacterium]